MKDNLNFSNTFVFLFSIMILLSNWKFTMAALGHHTLDQWSRDLDPDFTLGNCLFGSVKLIKNANPDKYKYSGIGCIGNIRYKIWFSYRIFITWW